MSKSTLAVLSYVLLIFVGVPVFGIAWIEGSKFLGIKSVPVPVIGTGSMYPSLFWSKEEGGPENESEKMIEEYRSTPHLYRRFKGITFAGRTYLRRSIEFGDMVAFRNDQTRSILESEGHDISAGFVKRIIGLPGDTIELRDGFVYKNGSLLEEPYIASPRSTYGGTSISDCQPLRLSEGIYLVLGDNRKVSSDSRFDLGLIKEEDIEYLLPYAEQNIYHSLWRNPSADKDLLGNPTLSSSEFIDLLNGQRKRLGLTPLSPQLSLIKSSGLRADKLLQNPETSYDLKQAMSSSSYSNIVLGEFVSRGHFSAQELLENLLFNGKTATQVLNEEYDDIGLTAQSRVVNGCPTQIIVGHLGGYIPPEYSKDTLESWQGLRDNLIEIIPTWEQALGNDLVNQSDLVELLTVLRRRLGLAQSVLNTMEKREWLSPDQESQILSDKQDGIVAQSLSNKLNGE